jgi:hypothetical protein
VVLPAPPETLPPADGEVELPVEPDVCPPTDGEPELGLVVPVLPPVEGVAAPAPELLPGVVIEPAAPALPALPPVEGVAAPAPELLPGVVIEPAAPALPALPPVEGVAAPELPIEPDAPMLPELPPGVLLVPGAAVGAIPPGDTVLPGGQSCWDLVASLEPAPLPVVPLGLDPELWAKTTGESPKAMPRARPRARNFVILLTPPARPRGGARLFTRGPTLGPPCVCKGNTVPAGAHGGHWLCYEPARRRAARRRQRAGAARPPGRKSPTRTSITP